MPVAARTNKLLMFTSQKFSGAGLFRVGICTCMCVSVCMCVCVCVNIKVNDSCCA